MTKVCNFSGKVFLLAIASVFIFSCGGGGGGAQKSAGTAAPSGELFKEKSESVSNAKASSDSAANVGGKLVDNMANPTGAEEPDSDNMYRSDMYRSDMYRSDSFLSSDSFYKAMASLTSNKLCTYKQDKNTGLFNCEANSVQDPFAEGSFIEFQYSSGTKIRYSGFKTSSVKAQGCVGSGFEFTAKISYDEELAKENSADKDNFAPVPTTFSGSELTYSTEVCRKVEKSGSPFMAELSKVTERKEFSISGKMIQRKKDGTVAAESTLNGVKISEAFSSSRGDDSTGAQDSVEKIITGTIEDILNGNTKILNSTVTATISETSSGAQKNQHDVAEEIKIEEGSDWLIYNVTGVSEFETDSAGKPTAVVNSMSGTVKFGPKGQDEANYAEIAEIRAVKTDSLDLEVVENDGTTADYHRIASEDFLPSMVEVPRFLLSEEVKKSFFGGTYDGIFTDGNSSALKLEDEGTGGKKIKGTLTLKVKNEADASKAADPNAAPADEFQDVVADITGSIDSSDETKALITLKLPEIGESEAEDREYDAEITEAGLKLVNKADSEDELFFSLRINTSEGGDFSVEADASPIKDDTPFTLTTKALKEDGSSRNFTGFVSLRAFYKIGNKLTKLAMKPQRTRVFKGRGQAQATILTDGRTLPNVIIQAYILDENGQVEKLGNSKTVQVINKSADATFVSYEMKENVTLDQPFDIKVSLSDADGKAKTISGAAVLELDSFGFPVGFVKDGESCKRAANATSAGSVSLQIKDGVAELKAKVCTPEGSSGRSFDQAVPMLIVVNSAELSLNSQKELMVAPAPPEAFEVNLKRRGFSGKVPYKSGFNIVVNSLKSGSKKDFSYSGRVSLSAELRDSSGAVLSSNVKLSVDFVDLQNGVGFQQDVKLELDSFPEAGAKLFVKADDSLSFSEPIVGESEATGIFFEPSGLKVELIDFDGENVEGKDRTFFYGYPVKLRVSALTTEFSSEGNILTDLDTNVNVEYLSGRSFRINDKAQKSFLKQPMAAGVFETSALLFKPEDLSVDQDLMVDVSLEFTEFNRLKVNSKPLEFRQPLPHDFAIETNELASGVIIAGQVITGEVKALNHKKEVETLFNGKGEIFVETTDEQGNKVKVSASKSELQFKDGIAVLDSAQDRFFLDSGVKPSDNATFSVEVRRDDINWVSRKDEAVAIQGAAALLTVAKRSQDNNNKFFSNREFFVDVEFGDRELPAGSQIELLFESTSGLNQADITVDGTPFTLGVAKALPGNGKKVSYTVNLIHKDSSTQIFRTTVRAIVPVNFNWPDISNKIADTSIELKPTRPDKFEVVVNHTDPNRKRDYFYPGEKINVIFKALDKAGNIDTNFNGCAYVRAVDLDTDKKLVVRRTNTGSTINSQTCPKGDISADYIQFVPFINGRADFDSTEKRMIIDGDNENHGRLKLEALYPLDETVEIDSQEIKLVYAPELKTDAQLFLLEDHVLDVDFGFAVNSDLKYKFYTQGNTSYEVKADGNEIYKSNQDQIELDDSKDLSLAALSQKSIVINADSLSLNDEQSDEFYSELVSQGLDSYIVVWDPDLAPDTGVNNDQCLEYSNGSASTQQGQLPSPVYCWKIQLRHNLPLIAKINFNWQKSGDGASVLHRYEALQVALQAVDSKDRRAYWLGQDRAVSIIAEADENGNVTPLTKMSDGEPVKFCDGEIRFEKPGLGQGAANSKSDPSNGNGYPSNYDPANAGGEDHKGDGCPENSLAFSDELNFSSSKLKVSLTKLNGQSLNAEKGFSFIGSADILTTKTDYEFGEDIDVSITFPASVDDNYYFVVVTKTWIEQLEKMQANDNLEDLSPFKTCNPAASSGSCNADEACLSFSDYSKAGYCEKTSCNSDSDCVLGTCSGSNKCEAASYKEIQTEFDAASDLNDSLSLSFKKPDGSSFPESSVLGKDKDVLLLDQKANKTDRNFSLNLTSNYRKDAELFLVAAYFSPRAGSTISVADAIGGTGEDLTRYFKPILLGKRKLNFSKIEVSNWEISLTDLPEDYILGPGIAARGLVKALDSNGQLVTKIQGTMFAKFVDLDGNSIGYDYEVSFSGGQAILPGCEDLSDKLNCTDSYLINPCKSKSSGSVQDRIFHCDSNAHNVKLTLYSGRRTGEPLGQSSKIHLLSDFKAEPSDELSSYGNDNSKIYQLPLNDFANKTADLSIAFEPESSLPQGSSYSGAYLKIEKQTLTSSDVSEDGSVNGVPSTNTVIFKGSSMPATDLVEDLAFVEGNLAQRPFDYLFAYQFGKDTNNNSNGSGCCSFSDDGSCGESSLFCHSGRDACVDSCGGKSFDPSGYPIIQQGEKGCCSWSEDGQCDVTSAYCNSGQDACINNCSGRSFDPNGEPRVDSPANSNKPDNGQSVLVKLVLPLPDDVSPSSELSDIAGKTFVNEFFIESSSSSVTAKINGSDYSELNGSSYRGFGLAVSKSDPSKGFLNCWASNGEFVNGVAEVRFYSKHAVPVDPNNLPDRPCDSGDVQMPPDDYDFKFLVIGANTSQSVIFDLGFDFKLFSELFAKVKLDDGAELPTLIRSESRYDLPIKLEFFDSQGNPVAYNFSGALDIKHSFTSISAGSFMNHSESWRASLCHDYMTEFECGIPDWNVDFTDNKGTASIYGKNIGKIQDVKFSFSQYSQFKNPDTLDVMIPELIILEANDSSDILDFADGSVDSVDPKIRIDFTKGYGGERFSSNSPTNDIPADFNARLCIDSSVSGKSLGVLNVGGSDLDFNSNTKNCVEVPVNSGSSGDIAVTGLDDYVNVLISLENDSQIVIQKSGSLKPFDPVRNLNVSLKEEADLADSDNFGNFSDRVLKITAPADITGKIIKIVPELNNPQQHYHNYKIDQHQDFTLEPVIVVDQNEDGVFSSSETVDNSNGYTFTFSGSEKSISLRARLKFPDGAEVNFFDHKNMKLKLYLVDGSNETLISDNNDPNSFRIGYIIPKEITSEETIPSIHKLHEQINFKLVPVFKDDSGNVVTGLESFRARMNYRFDQTSVSSNQSGDTPSVCRDHNNKNCEQDEIFSNDGYQYDQHIHRFGIIKDLTITPLNNQKQDFGNSVVLAEYIAVIGNGSDGSKEISLTVTNGTSPESRDPKFNIDLGITTAISSNFNASICLFSSNAGTVTVAGNSLDLASGEKCYDQSFSNGVSGDVSISGLSEEANITFKVKSGSRTVWQDSRNVAPYNALDYLELNIRDSQGNEASSFGQFDERVLTVTAAEAITATLTLKPVSNENHHNNNDEEKASYKLFVADSQGQYSEVSDDGLDIVFNNETTKSISIKARKRYGTEPNDWFGDTNDLQRFSSQEKLGLFEKSSGNLKQESSQMQINLLMPRYYTSDNDLSGYIIKSDTQLPITILPVFKDSAGNTVSVSDFTGNFKVKVSFDVASLSSEVPEFCGQGQVSCDRDIRFNNGQSSESFYLRGHGLVKNLVMIPNPATYSNFMGTDENTLKNEADSVSQIIVLQDGNIGFEFNDGDSANDPRPKVAINLNLPGITPDFSIPVKITDFTGSVASFEFGGQTGASPITSSLTASGGQIDDQDIVAKDAQGNNIGVLQSIAVSILSSSGAQIASRTESLSSFLDYFVQLPTGNTLYKGESASTIYHEVDFSSADEKISITLTNNSTSNIEFEIGHLDGDLCNRLRYENAGSEKDFSGSAEDQHIVLAGGSTTTISLRLNPDYFQNFIAERYNYQTVCSVEIYSTVENGEYYDEDKISFGVAWKEDPRPRLFINDSSGCGNFALSSNQTVKDACGNTKLVTGFGGFSDPDSSGTLRRSFGIGNNAQGATEDLTINSISLVKAADVNTSCAAFSVTSQSFSGISPDSGTNFDLIFTETQTAENCKMIIDFANATNMEIPISYSANGNDFSRAQ